MAAHAHLQYGHCPYIIGSVFKSTRAKSVTRALYPVAAFHQTRNGSQLVLGAGRPSCGIFRRVKRPRPWRGTPRFSVIDSNTIFLFQRTAFIFCFSVCSRWHSTPRAASRAVPRRQRVTSQRHLQTLPPSCGRLRRVPAHNGAMCPVQLVCLLSQIHTLQSTDALRTLEGHKDRLSRLAWHPFGESMLFERLFRRQLWQNLGFVGRHIATTSFDHTWRLWDLETGQQLQLQVMLVIWQGQVVYIDDLFSFHGLH